MQFMRGVIVAGVIVVGWNAYLLYVAVGLNDPLADSYVHEAR